MVGKMDWMAARDLMSLAYRWFPDDDHSPWWWAWSYLRAAILGSDDRRAYLFYRQKHVHSVRVARFRQAWWFVTHRDEWRQAS